jgi:hypothetical protein
VYSEFLLVLKTLIFARQFPKVSKPVDLLKGWSARHIVECYPHIRMQTKRRVVNNVSGTDFAPGVAQNWRWYFMVEKADEVHLLK